MIERDTENRPKDCRDEGFEANRGEKIDEPGYGTKRIKSVEQSMLMRPLSVNVAPVESRRQQ
jgi:hypothetical protein